MRIGQSSPARQLCPPWPPRCRSPRRAGAVATLHPTASAPHGALRRAERQARGEGGGGRATQFCAAPRFFWPRPHGNSPMPRPTTTTARDSSGAAEDRLTRGGGLRAPPCPPVRAWAAGGRAATRLCSRGTRRTAPAIGPARALHPRRAPFGASGRGMISLCAAPSERQTRCSAWARRLWGSCQAECCTAGCARPRQRRARDCRPPGPSGCGRRIRAARLTPRVTAKQPQGARRRAAAGDGVTLAGRLTRALFLPRALLALQRPCHRARGAQDPRRACCRQGRRRRQRTCAERPSQAAIFWRPGRSLSRCSAHSTQKWPAQLTTCALSLSSL